MFRRVLAQMQRVADLASDGWTKDTRESWTLLCSATAVLSKADERRWNSDCRGDNDKVTHGHSEVTCVWGNGHGVSLLVMNSWLSTTERSLYVASAL